MKNKKVIAALSTVALVAAGICGAAIHGLASEPVIIETPVPYTVEKIVNVTVPVEVIKEVEVEKIVSIEDESFLKLVCERSLYDDLMECKEEIKAEDAAIALALDKIKADIAEELEDEDIVEDEKDVRVIKVYSDFEDIEVTDSDFDSDEYSFDIKVKVEDKDTDEKFEVLVSVDVEDSEAEIKAVEVI